VWWRETEEVETMVERKVSMMEILLDQSMAGEMGRIAAGKMAGDWAA
jgi:hypothetical protein